MRQITRMLMVGCMCGFVCSGIALSASNAYAEDCANINTNPVWQDKTEIMGMLIKEKAYADALVVAKELDEICSSTPMLNYMMANLYKQMGNQERVNFHLQKAVDATQNYNVEKDLLNKIWTEKYLAMHPEAEPEAIQGLNNTIKEQNEAMQALKDEVELGKRKLIEQEAGFQMDAQLHTSRYAAGMWTGVAFLGAGAALVGVGAGLAFSNDKPIDFGKEEDETISDNNGNEKPNVKAKVRTPTHVYSGLIGGGAMLLVAGAVLTGIMGHYYVISKQKDEKLSFKVSPVSTSLTLTF